MPANSPVTVETRSGDAELRPVTHRTKHRKEVKRYHQRQQNKQLREEAKERDAQLFLFKRSSNAAAETAAATTAAKKGSMNATAARNGAAKGRSEKDAETVKAITDKNPETSKDATVLAGATPVESQLAAPLLPPVASNWDFDFVLRKQNTAVAAATDDSLAASTTPAATTAGATSSVGGGFSEVTQQTLVSANTRSLTAFPVPMNNALSLIATTRCPQQRDYNATHNVSNSNTGENRVNGGGSRNRPSSNSAPISVLPIDNAVTSSITKLLNNAHVQRVEGVPAIPMEMPLSAGTDLNRPPRSYLTLDPIYNVHQHAPGFVRDQRVALQHMLATAMANWKDMQLNALIVTSAEAMRTIFEQVYVPSRPLALRVRRIGPTIIIDSRASQPSQVREMRQQALFSKALYLMMETRGRDLAAGAAAAGAAAAAAAAGKGETATTTAAATSTSDAARMALALPERRLSGLAASDPLLFGVNLHRYSQLLRWHIDATELLVGNDAPIIVDERTGTEQLVHIKAADEVDSTDTEQRETLRCWFDAMLANVSHVGTYLHCDGTVLSYQVKKTNDLLGYLEARMAGAALSFTSTTLQWLVKHCQRDGGTYAMFRDFNTDYLTLYELPEMDDTNEFMAETARHFSRSPAPAEEASNSRDSCNNGAGGNNNSGATDGPYASYPGSAPHLNRFSLNFGRACFNIGQHLYRGGDVSRANDALTLLHRSLRVFLPCCVTEGVARETVVEVVQMLPALVSRKMQADANSRAAAVVSSNGGSGSACSTRSKIGDGGLGYGSAEKTPAGFVTASCSSPELYRDALVLCGQFEIPIRRVFVEVSGENGDALMQAFFARCLVASSAAVCTVVAASLEAYYCGCHHLRVMRKARSEAKAKDKNNGGAPSATAPSSTGATAFRGVDHRDDVMAVLASMIQDLLQVVVEGLVRLEETSALMSPLHAAEVTTTATTATTVSTTTTSKPITVTVPQTAADPWTFPSYTTTVTTAASTSSTGVGAAGNAKNTATTKEELSSAGRSSSASSGSVLSTTCSVHGEDGDDTTTATTTTAAAQSYHHRRKHTSSPANIAVTAAQNGGLVVEGGTVKASRIGTVVDPRTQVDTIPLRSALCELYGDIVMIAMADSASGFTTRALAELGARLEVRASEQTQRLPTTLIWLTSLKTDLVSLSFTALRFYGRVATHTRRHLVKLAQVYYLVGKEHHRTARYTKALEALHHAKSLLQASHKAPEEVAFGDAFGSHGIVQWADVMLLLGNVYRSVVERKLETALGVAVRTVAQPLLVGPLHNLPEEADTFFAQSLNAYKQGGQDEGCRSAKSCTLLIYASVLMERIALSGEPASNADSQRIYDLLRDSEALAPTLYVEEREWQTMRLFTVTSPAAADSALARNAEDVLLHFSCCNSQPPKAGSNMLDAQKQPLWVDADVADCGCHRRERLVVPPPCSMLAEMQKALVCCGMVERMSPGFTLAAAGAAGCSAPSSASSMRRKGDVAKPTSPLANLNDKYRNLLCWVGRAAAFLTTAMRTYLKTKDVWHTAAVRHQWMSTLRTWGERTVGSCLHRMVCMITLRLLNAAQGQLLGQKQAEARDAFKQVTTQLDAVSSASADSDEAHEFITRLLRELNALLTPFTEW